jgi:hypothetical protein
MQPIHHPDFKHTALVDATDGRHAVNIALLRWTADAKQVNLTQWELPPDAVGRIYTVDVFIGQVVGVKYADWAKGVHRGKRGHNSAKSGKKGKYLTAPHIHLSNIKTGKHRHYRPFVHTIIAYVYPPLREQYAQAVMNDMTANNRSFKGACVQINHIDKDIYNNTALNLEAVTASANSIHREIATAGVALSMRCYNRTATQDVVDYYDSNITDAEAYIERMCQQLSNAKLPTDTEYITVGIQSVTGNKVKPVQVANQSVWGILMGLYTVKAHHICSLN